MGIGFFLLTASQANPENRTMLPKLAFTSFASRYRAPKMEEGFGEIIEVDFEVSARLDTHRVGLINGIEC
jgi:bifunctional polynucleotide phosphatase/kinase